ncbi:glycosyltransferase family 2 protein [Acidipropionibacterium jensenii]|uniref:glycosyltransferase family 2 protein n=1 Tax=Acidipropionibacterium jensenii TaxID=1749 RepID=UPI00110A0DE3|nr:glycosyltransferase family 2 protein [Acidipropionibacterium jensenii]QCV87447.1 glycosyltransferase family 2 protein [Acidipropionibacterium jensenii]
MVLVRKSDISVVMVTFGASEMVQKSLDVLRPTTLNTVVIWDNTQDGNEAGALARLTGDHVTVFSDGSNGGFGAGCNKGFKKTSSKYVAFVNPDCLVTADQLLALAEDIEEYGGQVGAVVPRMVYPDGQIGISGGPRVSISKELLAATRIDDVLPERIRKVAISAYDRVFVRGSGYSKVYESGGLLDTEWVSGFCMIMRSSTFQAVGGFDERFFLYFEDVELSNRIRNAGFRVAIDRNVTAVHFESVTTKNGKGSAYWRGMATYFDIKKFPVRSRIAQLMAGLA